MVGQYTPLRILSTKDKCCFDWNAFHSIIVQLRTGCKHRLAPSAHQARTATIEHTINSTPSVQSNLHFVLQKNVLCVSIITSTIDIQREGDLG